MLYIKFKLSKKITEYAYVFRDTMIKFSLAYIS